MDIGERVSSGRGGDEGFVTGEGGCHAVRAVTRNGRTRIMLQFPRVGGGGEGMREEGERKKVRSRGANVEGVGHGDSEERRLGTEVQQGQTSDAGMLDSLRRCVPLSRPISVLAQVGELGKPSNTSPKRDKTEDKEAHRAAAYTTPATKHHTRTGKQRKAIKFPDMEEDAKQAEEEETELLILPPLKVTALLVL
jgi:hypothetical protein